MIRRWNVQGKNMWFGVSLQSVGMKILYVLLKNSGSHDTIYRLSNLAKHRFLSKFESHNTIYTFKNYFATVFSAISYQFSANKRYPNKPLV